jgi:chaperonin GroEL
MDKEFEKNIPDAIKNKPIKNNNSEEDVILNSAINMVADNVVSKHKLRRVQKEILNKLREYITATYGPLGSNTVIVTGNNKQTIQANYSKDGLKVVKNITFNMPLEMAIHSQIEDIARFVEHQVGDGTTSSIILSSYIFNGLSYLEESTQIPPRELVNRFMKITDNIKSRILKRKQECDLDKIYKIAMISTNGNREVSNNIYNIYKEYGMDVSIDVSISNDTDSKIKIYDGLIINEGYSDPAYINNTIDNTADIHNAHVYYFRDPIDTGEMIAYMEQILIKNIFEPSQDNEDMIPTVIISPRISRDASGLLTKLITLLYNYNKDGMQSRKPPVLVITNISGTDEDITSDIAKLCRCKDIAKYIDPNIQEEAQKKGEAPTIENVHEWYGECELVVADTDKTKFIRPKAIVDENDTTYEMLINFLKAEIKKSKEENADALEIGRLKKRLKCLEANMVEYLIGGITVSDRDAVRDLVEDAVKNCASAAENGVGYAANFEGLLAATEAKNDNIYFDIDYSISEIIELAYRNAAIDLYKSVVPEKKAEEYLEASLQNKRPFNVVDISRRIDSENPGDDVLTSINTDVEILNAISKIVTIMVTANQALVQTPELNRY